MLPALYSRSGSKIQSKPREHKGVVIEEQVRLVIRIEGPRVFAIFSPAQELPKLGQHHWQRKTDGDHHTIVQMCYIEFSMQPRQLPLTLWGDMAGR